MKRILITGGTVFVSRFIAEYYIVMGYEVYVLRSLPMQNSFWRIVIIWEKNFVSFTLML